MRYDWVSSLLTFFSVVFIFVEQAELFLRIMSPCTDDLSTFV